MRTIVVDIKSVATELDYVGLNVISNDEIILKTSNNVMMIEDKHLDNLQVFARVYGKALREVPLSYTIMKHCSCCNGSGFEIDIKRNEFGQKID
jgi:hypothetical protein